MAKHPVINKHEHEQTENKANVDGTSPPPICMKCNNVISDNEEGVQSEKSNQIVLDAIPRYLVDNNFSKDDENDWRLVEERERIARREWETKKKEELERQNMNSIFNQPSTSQSTHLEGRQRMNSILDQPSTSQSTHLEGYLTQSLIDSAVKKNNNVTVVPVNRQLQAQDLYNSRPLRANAETYELENFSKNVMLIFNHYNIDSYTKPREGTHKDVDSLKNTFEKYNFTIIEREDRTRDEIFEILDEFCQNDFSEFGCVSVVVLTHGGDGGLLHAKDITYNESDILERFETHKNPSLVTKPKLFIFQACRGRHPSQSIKVQTRTVRLDGDDEDFFYTLPIESDILILHSTYPGNASHRETENGSWMIQTLCNRINELAGKEDLLTIVTRVQRDVAIDRENMRLNKWTSQNRVDKQMPVMTSTLIRKFELRAFTENSEMTGSINAIKETETDYIDMNRLRIVNGIDLNYFNYIKKCTAIYTEEIENLNDDFAKCLLNLARTFGSGQEFDETKMTMANAMCEHLERNIKNKETYKYLYLKRF